MEEQGANECHRTMTYIVVADDERVATAAAAAFVQVQAQVQVQHPSTPDLTNAIISTISRQHLHERCVVYASLLMDDVIARPGGDVNGMFRASIMVDFVMFVEYRSP